MAEKPIQLAVALHRVNSVVISCFSKRPCMHADWVTLPLACQSAGCCLARAPTSSGMRSRPLEACLHKPSKVGRPPVEAMQNIIVLTVFEAGNAPVS